MIINIGKNKLLKSLVIPGKGYTFTISNKHKLMETKHSTGIWEIDLNSFPPIIFTTKELDGESNQPAICFLNQTDLVDNRLGISEEEMEANGKLIKCSAQLLQKLILMTSLCKIKYGNLDADVWREICESEELIKKATE